MKDRSIGRRMREFGESKYRRIKDFAEDLEISPNQLQIYLRGDSNPGSAILQKLSALGCDIEWLLTGLTKEEKLKAKQKELDAVWDKLKKFGINNAKDLEALYSKDQYIMTVSQLVELAKDKQENYGKSKK